MSCNEPEFNRINVDFKRIQIKQRQLSFYDSNLSSSSAGVAAAEYVSFTLFQDRLSNTANEF